MFTASGLIRERTESKYVDSWKREFRSLFVKKIIITDNMDWSRPVRPRPKSYWPLTTGCKPVGSYRFERRKRSPLAGFGDFEETISEIPVIN